MRHACQLRTSGFFAALALAAVIVAGGCQSMHVRPVGELPPDEAPQGNPMPRELCKTVLPTYTIEPPDILMIEAIHIVPRQPYHLRTFDAIAVQVQGTLSDNPIAGVYPIQLGGLVNLGLPYGSVKVGGMTVSEAQAAIQQHLLHYLKEPVVSVTLADIAARQQIAGQHLVSPDGTVTLGSYGSVSVVGLSIAQAKLVIERYLAQFLEDPEISLDVFAYNSKVYYIVTQGAGLGDGVFRFPVTGNETVLDAISQINGLERVSSKRIWIARPTPDPCHVQVLPVRWEDITAQASTGTNYQIMPGDRIFIAEDKLIALDTSLGKIFAPVERIFGFTLLGTGTVTRLSGPVLKGGGNQQSTF